MTRLVLIGFAGALGALSRYGLQGWANHLLGRPTVLGTLLVNVTGAFLLGLIVELTDERGLLPAGWRPVLAAGFLGAYTTFSTLMFESVDRFENGAELVAIGNIVFSVALGLIAAYAGMQVGRTL